MNEPTIALDKLYFKKLMQAIYDMRLTQKKYFHTQWVR